MKGVEHTGFYKRRVPRYEAHKEHFGKAIRVQFYVMITQKRKKEL